MKKAVRFLLGDSGRDHDDVQQKNQIVESNRSPAKSIPKPPPLASTNDFQSLSTVGLESLATIVIDNGSGTIRAGWGGQVNPAVSFPSMVGSTALEAQPMPMTHPIKHGAVVDLDGLEMLWSSCFNTLEHTEQLGHMEDHCLLTTSRKTGLYSSPNDEREQMVQLAFEKFNFGACYVAVPAVLSMYTTGCLTGVAVDSGYRVTDIVPVYEGHCIPRVVSRLNMGGQDLTEFLYKMLKSQIPSLETYHEALDIVCQIKEQMCYVAGNYLTESRRTHTKTCYQPQQYTMPDGHLVIMDAERFRCPEALFRPTLLGLESLGLAQATAMSVTRCDNYLQPEMLHHVVLAGGNSILKGFKGRMWKDLVTITKKDVNCCLPNPPAFNAEDNYVNAPWRGGSILSSKPSFRAMCITRNEYDEEGSTIVRKKCF